AATPPTIDHNKSESRAPPSCGPPALRSAKATLLTNQREIHTDSATPAAASACDKRAVASESSMRTSRPIQGKRKTEFSISKKSAANCKRTPSLVAEVRAACADRAATTRLSKHENRRTMM